MPGENADSRRSSAAINDPMTDAASSPDFSPSFLAAREQADTAAETERSAWEALQGRPDTDREALKAWRQAHQAAGEAQARFAEEVRTWFSRGALD